MDSSTWAPAHACGPRAVHACGHLCIPPTLVNACAPRARRRAARPRPVRRRATGGAQTAMLIGPHVWAPFVGSTSKSRKKLRGSTVMAMVAPGWARAGEGGAENP